MTAEQTASRGPRFPDDLAVVLLLVFLSNLAIVLPVISDSFIRAVLAIPFVLFLPGYVLIAVLFPETGKPPGDNVRGGNPTEGASVWEIKKPPGRVTNDRDRGIDNIERAGLSFAVSVALIPVLALVITVLPVEFGFVSMLLSINILTVGGTFIAAVRRLALPPQRQYAVPFRSWLLSAKNRTGTVDSRSSVVLNGALIIAIIFAVSAFAFAMVQPPDGEQYTELQLLTEENNGNLIASEYPDSISPNEPVPLHVQIGNHEQETTEYSVVIQIQQVAGDGADSTVTERTELDQFTTTLDHNETWSDERQLSATEELTGDELRLTVLLYEDDVPANPTRENAYRDAHLWVDVPAE